MKKLLEKFFAFLKAFADVGGEDEPDDENVVENLQQEVEEQSEPVEESQINVELIRYAPSNFSEGRDIADSIISGRTVVLNIKYLEFDVARRLVDFLCGIIYAQNGDYKRFEKDMTTLHVFAPHGINIEKDVIESHKIDEVDY